MKFEINFRKKHFYALIAVLAVFVGLAYVIAQASIHPGAWHSGSDIFIAPLIAGGVEATLQDWIGSLNQRTYALEQENRTIYQRIGQVAGIEDGPVVIENRISNPTQIQLSLPSRLSQGATPDSDYVANAYAYMLRFQNDGYLWFESYENPFYIARIDGRAVQTTCPNSVPFFSFGDDIFSDTITQRYSTNAVRETIQILRSVVIGPSSSSIITFNQMIGSSREGRNRIYAIKVKANKNYYLVYQGGSSNYQAPSCFINVFVKTTGLLEGTTNPIIMGATPLNPTTLYYSRVTEPQLTLGG